VSTQALRSSREQRGRTDWDAKPDGNRRSVQLVHVPAGVHPTPAGSPLARGRAAGYWRRRACQSRGVGGQSSSDQC